MTSQSPKNRLRSQGFTLVELLVSAVLIGVVMMIMLMATSTSMGIWRSSERAISVDREGRNALAVIADDFANMLPVSSNAPDFMQPRIGLAGGPVFIECFVLRPRDYQNEAEPNDGDVCFVRYRYQDGRIQRAVVDSVATFEAMRNGQTPVSQEADYEVLSENLPQFNINAYDELGVDLANAQNNMQDRRRVRFVGMSLQSLDADEARNRELGINLRTSGAAAGQLSSQKYFSSFFEVPRPPL